jgi:DNA (cytosine-5)-methyltransferase 1
MPPRILKAIFYNVPQKRERVLIVGIRKDISMELFEFPKPYKRIYNVRDALKKGELFATDVPESPGSLYPKSKFKVLELVPEGGYWRDLPPEIQKDYMGGSFYLGGGKTGMARRMSWDEPSLTLTCSPAQKQTERCHPKETRPFTIREYARIQTFPDDWEFSGSVSQQYKQIGNAVPVNLAKEVGYSIIKFLNSYYQ